MRSTPSKSRSARHWRRIAAAGAIALAASGCADTSPETATSPVLTLATTTAPEAAPTGSAISICTLLDGPGCVFDYGNFSEPTVIDNPYLPLVPGTRLIYDGTTNEEELLDHQVVITVTDLTKVIDGIDTVVSWDLDYSDGELAEAELAFFAQDDDGNVWRMGEHPEEYEDGEIVDSPTWLAGVDGAKAGISMLGDPVIGTLSYSQGWAPTVGFNDRAVVHEAGAADCTFYDCFDEVLVVAEFNVFEPGAFQLKYFAPGIGNIRVGWEGRDTTREELQLVAIAQLDAGELAAAAAAAFELEASAYEVSADVYGGTLPMQ